MLLRFRNNRGERLLGMARLTEGTFGSSDRRISVGEFAAEPLTAVGEVTLLEPQAVAVAEAFLVGAADGCVHFAGVVPRGRSRRQRGPVEGQIE